jgi:hypothetical protein
MAAADGQPKKSYLQTAQSIVAAKGPIGLYRGLIPNLGTSAFRYGIPFFLNKCMI